MDHDVLSDSSSSPKSDDSVKSSPTPDPCMPEVMKVLSGMCEETINPPALSRQRHKSSPALHARPPLDYPPTIRDSSTNAEPPPDWQNVTPKLEPDPDSNLPHSAPCAFARADRNGRGDASMQLQRVKTECGDATVGRSQVPGNFTRHTTDKSLCFSRFL